MGYAGVVTRAARVSVINNYYDVMFTYVHGYYKMNSHEGRHKHMLLDTGLLM